MFYSVSSAMPASSPAGMKWRCRPVSAPPHASTHATAMVNICVDAYRLTVMMSIGRSVRSSQAAFENIAATYNVNPDYRRPQLPAPMIYPAPDMSRKRPLQPDSATQMGRLLQPRPPHAYPTEFMATGPAYASTITAAGEQANKKKRGRPTKAEAQQRAQEAAARGEIYPPPRRGRASITGPPETSPSVQEARPQERTTPPPPAPQLGSAMTPQQQLGPEQGSESSSGKRRRTRPQPLELEKHREIESPLPYGSADPHRSQPYSTYTPISAPLPSSTETRDRDIRMEGVEENQPRTTTPHSFKDTVGI